MKENSKKYLGAKVRALRESAGMTQEDLSAACDVSWRTISNLERGVVVPDLFMLCRISQIFKVSIDEMLANDIRETKSLSRLGKENQGDEVQDHVCPGEELQHIGRPVENECDRGLCPAAEAARLQF